MHKEASQSNVEDPCGTIWKCLEEYSRRHSNVEASPSGTLWKCLLCTNSTCSPVRRRRRKSFCRLSLNLSEVWQRLQLGVVKIILLCTFTKTYQERDLCRYEEFWVKSPSFSSFDYVDKTALPHCQDTSVK